MSVYVCARACRSNDERLHASRAAGSLPAAQRPPPTAAPSAPPRARPSGPPAAATGASPPTAAAPAPWAAPSLRRAAPPPGPSVNIIATKKISDQSIIMTSGHIVS